MRIVPSCALGSLAPDEGDPVYYSWPWYHSITGLGLWVVLALAMVVPRANRTPGTLLILAPLAVVLVGWSVFAFIFMSVMKLTSSDLVMFDVLIYTLAVGSATCWLLSKGLAVGGWCRTLPVATGIALGVTLVGGLSLGFGSDQASAAIGAIGIMMIATVLGYLLAAQGYRSRRAWRFLLFQAAGNVVVSFVGVFIAIFVFWFVLGDVSFAFGMFMMAVIWGGLITGGIVFLVSLPFSVVGLCSPFFRQRLVSCLPEQGVLGETSRDLHSQP